MIYRLLLLAAFLVPGARAQDTTAVQEALYDRPFIGSLGQTSIGGYVEANSNYFVEDGITDGFSMELRRFNIFIFSSISSRIKLISELEFEHGTEEIALETALVDFQINPALILRGGIILPPIGAFNQNHDSPLWEFVDRPLVSTEIIPSTLSEVGFGAYGRFNRGRLGFTYDVYVTNGLGDGVISNDRGRTHLAAGKSEEQFGEDNNGTPAFSTRLAALDRRIGELGISLYTGIYNTFEADGMAIDERRRLSIVAVDFSANLRRLGIRGEVAFARIGVQDDLKELLGERQWGGHVDLIAPVWRPRFFGYENAVLNLNLRLEAVDFNVGSFTSTGENIYDELVAVVPGLSFRPTPGTVLRTNYRRHWYRDLVGNAAAMTGGFQVGFSTYF